MSQARVIDIYKPYKDSQTIERRDWEYPDDLVYRQSQLSSPQVWIPHFSAHVSCGLFGISDDYIEKYQSLDSRFIKNKASTFFFTAASDSMEPLIREGDILIVDRSLEVVNGRVAVVCLGGEMLCKRVIRREGQVLLRSENPAYADVVVTEEMDLVVFGVVTSIAREII